MEADIEGGEKEFDDILQTAMTRSGVMTVPDKVQQVTRKHLTKLAELIRVLKAAGVDDEMVRLSTKQLLASYEEELIKVLVDLASEDKS